jgi:CspA family cold shock protein
VKWFNAERGYGFIAPAGGGNDIFVHVSPLERSGLTALNEGQALAVDVVEGRKGLEATRARLTWLVPWGQSTGDGNTDASRQSRYGWAAGSAGRRAL